MHTTDKLTYMVVQTEKHDYTLEEYLELEEKAEYKNEYRDGDRLKLFQRE